MVRAFLRITIGFCLANLVSGVSLTLSVFPLSELFQKTNQLKQILALPVTTAISCGLFSLPLALPLLVLCERFSIRVVWIYSTIGMGLSALAYFFYFAEESAASTLLKDFAFLSLLLSGFLGGVTYWALAGRKAEGLLKGHKN